MPHYSYMSIMFQVKQIKIALIVGAFQKFKFKVCNFGADNIHIMGYW